MAVTGLNVIFVVNYGINQSVLVSNSPTPLSSVFMLQGASKNPSDEAFRFFNDEFTDCKHGSYKI
jgi:hypothetical protein